MEHLLERRADVNGTAAACGETALHWAAKRGDLTTAQLLVAASADINVSPPPTHCPSPSLALSPSPPSLAAVRPLSLLANPQRCCRRWSPAKGLARLPSAKARQRMRGCLQAPGRLADQTAPRAR